MRSWGQRERRWSIRRSLVNEGCGGGKEREPSSGRNHCIDGSDPCDRIRTVSAKHDGGHGEGGAEAVARTKEGKEENFSEGFSLEEASVLIG